MGTALSGFAGSKRSGLPHRSTYAARAISFSASVVVALLSVRNIARVLTGVEAQGELDVLQPVGAGELELLHRLVGTMRLTIGGASRPTRAIMIAGDFFRRSTGTS